MSGRIGKRTALKRLNVHGVSNKAVKKRLTAQKKTLKSAKMAAVRQLANAATVGFLGIEKKFLDTYRSGTEITSAVALTGGEYDPTSGCTGCLSIPAQGDTEQQRDGKKFVIDSLILKGVVFDEQTASEAVAVSRRVFVAVVLDTQTNGAQMNSEDCFKSLGGVAYLNATPLKNLLSGNRFRILKAHVFDLTPPGVAAAGAVAHNAVTRQFDWYIPFKGGLQVNCRDGDTSGTTANVANVVDNSLHVIAFSTHTGTYITYNARVRFQG